MKRLLAILVLVLAALAAQSQKSAIRGSVFDESSGESLVGVTIMIKGTTTGTITDLDGMFSLDVAPGTYDLQLSYISYQTLAIERVVIKPNEVKQLYNLKMKESTIVSKEVVISAEMARTSESAINIVKRKSAVIMDGISSTRMQLTGDGTAVEAAKRVTGVSVEGGKYVYVRGLGDRYSKTTLNLMDIPGLDPDRNSLQMDIFPTGLIDNIMVSKNFTADMPADFTGGMLNIETKDFPEQKTFNVSAGITYNPGMHFRSDNLSYEGGSTDFLGFDDGTRAIPDRARKSNIPTPISGASAQEVADFISSFNPQLGAMKKTSLMDYSLGLSLGNQVDLEKRKDRLGNTPKLGYILSLSYKSDYRYYDDVTNSEYQRSIDPDNYDLRYATIQRGAMGEHGVLLGAIAGLAYKTTLSKVRVTLLHLQNGESRAARFSIVNDGAAVGQSGYEASSDNLEYNQRSLTNLFINGKHMSKNRQWETDWRLSPTLSTSTDPDIRKTAFTFTGLDTLFSAGAGGNPSRIWRYLTEVNLSSRLDATRSYSLWDRDAKLRLGSSQNYKRRTYEILFFDIQFFGTQDWTNPDPSQVLRPENIYPNKPNSIYYQSGNNNPNPNEYVSGASNTAFYVSNEFNPIEKLKTVLGVRAEYYVQRHTGRDQTYASGDEVNGRNLVNEKVLESLDLFPSLNLIYSLSKDQNIRASYTRTIARPSFKELSFAQIIDPITNRIFNGSLFTYADWDGKLTETRIHNIDLRWEWFLEQGQIFSVSAFYKRFDKPIEMVRIPEQQTSTEYQVRNVGDGQLLGLELEFRKDLGFIAPALKNFNISGNFTLVESRIEMTQAEFKSRSTFLKTGENLKRYRQMAGQSPYMVNAGLVYSNAAIGFDAGLFYNVKGPTLSIVGGGLFPDIYVDPFHHLNFSMKKKLGIDNRTSLDFKAGNLLGQWDQSYYSSYLAGEEIFSRMSPGRTFSLGVSHRF